MKRFVPGGFVVVAVLLALVGGAGSAAPIPKDATKVEPTPDLKAFFDTVGKAVKNEKWPAEADEKKLKDTAQVVFERVLKAAEQKERKLPVDFEKPTKADVVKEYNETVLNKGFVISSDVRVTAAWDSVIFASGNVQITTARNCVIVAQNVRCTSADNCVVIAGEFIRLTSAQTRDGSAPSVLVAGQWIRTTGMNGTICHVIRPSGQPDPDEAKRAGNGNGNGPHPAIHTNGADQVIFLNAFDESRANNPKDCTYLPQKYPIAK
jgi:hypothetical protein